MHARAPWALALALAAASAAAEPPAAPAFAPPNLSETGVRALAASCAACHGTDGHAVRNSPVAALAGKPRDEIVQALGQFRAGTKPATVMHQLVKGFGDAEVAALADHFARQPR